MGHSLTDEETYFLSGLGFSADDVYDVRGVSKWIWQKQAKEAGKDIVLGNECRKGGHRLRTRAGHCLQCDPKKISFQQRHSGKGYVYIAGSMSGRLIKIGTCSGLDQRLRQIRAERY
jgi:hypothetical protein